MVVVHVVVFSVIFKNSLLARWLVRELTSPWEDWPRVGLSSKHHRKSINDNGCCTCRFRTVKH